MRLAADETSYCLSELSSVSDNATDFLTEDHVIAPDHIGTAPAGWREIRLLMPRSVFGYWGKFHWVPSQGRLDVTHPGIFYSTAQSNAGAARLFMDVGMGDERNLYVLGGVAMIVVAVWFFSLSW